MSDRESPPNPFPGFRPFREDETEFFFGREEAAQELLGRLGRTSFVAVLGASGFGKSSLVRCGILPALRLGLLGQTGSRWRIAEFRPRDDPVGQMARGLGRAGLGRAGDGPLDADELIEASLRRSSRGLVRVVESSDLGPDENLLVFVDQFEELFRFRDQIRSEQKSNDDLAFVKLLLEAARQTRGAIESGVRPLSSRIFVLLTMRSDFLGECAHHEGLTAWINDGFYLVPLLNRRQRRAAIEGPIAVAEADITPRLVNRLLSDAGEDLSRLPILAHALMRTWEKWAERMASGIAVEGCDADKLDLCDYDRAKRMSGALDDHLGEIVASLGPTQQALVKPVFQRLSQVTPEGQQVRRPAHFTELCEIIGARGAGSDVARDVGGVIEAFRAERRTFLTPSSSVPLEDDPLIDISHESLIWNWTPLRDEWLAEEAESAAVYDDLADDAQEHFSELRGPLYGGSKLVFEGVKLKRARGWLRRWKDLEAARVWARPYDQRAKREDGFGQALAFLNRSGARLRRTRGLVAASVVALAVLAGVLIERERERERARQRLQTIELARAQGAADPLTGALVLASLAGQDDVDGRGLSAALSILSQTLPLASVRLPGEVKSLDVDSAATRALVVADSGGGRVAHLIGFEDGSTEALPWPDRSLRWGVLLPEGPLLLIEGRDEEPAPELPSGWRAIRIPPGGTWGRASEDRRRFLTVYPTIGGDRRGVAAGGVCVWTLSADGPDVAESEATRGTCRDGTWLPSRDIVDASFSRDADFVVDWSFTLAEESAAAEGGDQDLEFVSRVRARPVDGDSSRARDIVVPPGTRFALQDVLHATYVPDRDLFVIGQQRATWFQDERRRCEVSGNAPVLLTSTRRDDLAIEAGAPETAIAIVTVAQDVTRRVSLGDDDGTCQPFDSAFDAAFVTSGPDEDPIFAVVDEGHRFLATASDDRIVRIFCLLETSLCGGDLNQSFGSRHLTLRGHAEAITALALRPAAARIVTADRAGEVRLWDLAGTRWDRVVDRSPPRESPIGRIPTAFTAIALDAEGRRAAVAVSPGIVRVRDLATGDSLVLEPPDPERVSAIAFAPDGGRLAVGTASGVTVWGLADPALEPTTWTTEVPVRDLAFVRPDSLLVLDDDGLARLFEVGGAAAGHEVAASAEAVASDGAGSVAVRTRTVILRDAAGDFDTLAARSFGDGPLASIGNALGGPRVEDVRYSPGGRRIAIRYSDSISVRSTEVDAAGLAVEPPLLLAGSGVSSIAFASDSVLLLGRGRNGTAAIRLPDGTPHPDLDLTSIRAPQIWSGASGRWVVGRATAPDATVELRAWPLTWAGVVERLNEVTRACLDAESRQRYLRESHTDAERAVRRCTEAGVATKGEEP